MRRFILETDYPAIARWWEARGAKIPPFVLLPDTGVVAETPEGPTACAFLYEDRAGKVAMIEWECTNPEVGPMRALLGLNRIFDFFETYCSEKGIVALLSWTAEERGDGRILRARGWVQWPGPRHELMCFQPAPKEAA